MSATKKSFDTPDETRTPNKAKVEVVNLGGHKAARMTLEPGWRWSECIKPLVGTDTCQQLHVGTVVSGSLHIKTDDGSEIDILPGEAYVIEPGHDAWNAGNEPFVGYEFESHTAESFATPE
jgi:mannose-6-phosphate isomerase-like protein (cupin superfamily)